MSTAMHMSSSPPVHYRFFFLHPFLFTLLSLLTKWSHQSPYLYLIPAPRRGENNLQGLDFICCRSDSSYFYHVCTMVISCHCIIACSYHIYQQISQLWICIYWFWVVTVHYFLGLCYREILPSLFSKEMLIVDNIIVLNILLLMFILFARVFWTLAHSRTTCSLPVLLFHNFLSSLMVYLVMYIPPSLLYTVYTV